MNKATFKEWTLSKLDKAFGIKQIKECSLLTDWENIITTITEFQKEYLIDLQETLNRGGDEWNEVELENKFISPLIMASKIDNEAFSYFLQRELSGIVGDYELSGNVDGMIATGYRSPEVPLFCLHEYKRKRAIENQGHPNAQVLASMLVAREMNNNKKSIYGLFIIGTMWQFIVLNHQEYCISKKYDASASRNGLSDIFAIFQMIKALKIIIEKELL